MHRWITGLLLLIGLLRSEAGRAQSADLIAELSATPSAGLAVGSDLVVIATVRNAGPSAASTVFAQVSSPPAGPEGFLFDSLGVEAGGCSIDSLDIEPPTFNVYWTLSAIPAGAFATCALRFRVRTAPLTGSTSLYLAASAGTPDPAPQNNTASLDVGFQTVSADVASVPALHHYGMAMLMVGMCILAALARRRMSLVRDARGRSRRHHMTDELRNSWCSPHSLGSARWERTESVPGRAARLRRRLCGAVVLSHCDCQTGYLPLT